jgi:hypothetical protein
MNVFQITANVPGKGRSRSSPHPPSKTPQPHSTADPRTRTATPASPSAAPSSCPIPTASSVRSLPTANP